MASAPVLAQVNVGPSSRLRSLVPAAELETAATQEYGKLLVQAREQRALAPESHPQLQRLRAISPRRLIAQSSQWNDRARQWRWEVNLIGSKQINAFCMPGGKIAVFTGLLDQLQLTDDETAMVVGHEMAHALREHARERIAKSQGTGTLLSLGAQLLGLGQLGRRGGQHGDPAADLALQPRRRDRRRPGRPGAGRACRLPARRRRSACGKRWAAPPAAMAARHSCPPTPPVPTASDACRQNVPRVRGLYQQAVARR